jgi:hypothetical protein
MNTGFPGPTDYSSRRSASAGPRPGNWDQSGQPRGFPSGGLRASDSERDAALAELSEHFQAGRLTTDELHERTSRILAARTGDELEVQLRDLPNLAAPAAAPPRCPQPRIASYVAPRLIMAVMILAVIASVLALGSGHHGVHSWNAAVPVIVILLVLRRLVRHR